MLVTLKEVLSIAEEKQCAIGAFNGTNLASLTAVIHAAEETGMPIILMHAQVHEPLAPLRWMGPAYVAAAKLARVPVCVHLDHGVDLDYIQCALDLGFTGAMYDGSLLSYEENVKNTRVARKMTDAVGAGLEAEIGAMGTSGVRTSIYTDPDQAAQFVADTGVDALACSFGTVHGLYTSTPKLNFDIVSRVRALTNIPVVMHGGSGVSHEDYRKAIACGVRKINYYTYMAKAGGDAVCAAIRARDENAGTLCFHDIEQMAIEPMQKDVCAAIRVFSLND